jgi:hypothetical protein
VLIRSRLLLASLVGLGTTVLLASPADPSAHFDQHIAKPRLTPAKSGAPLLQTTRMGMPEPHMLHDARHMVTMCGGINGV